MLFIFQSLKSSVRRRYRDFESFHEVLHMFEHHSFLLWYKSDCDLIHWFQFFVRVPKLVWMCSSEQPHAGVTNLCNGGQFRRRKFCARESTGSWLIMSSILAAVHHSMYGSLSPLPRLQHSLYNLLQLRVLSMCSTQDIQLNWLTMALIMAFTECEWVYANIQWSEDTHPVLHSFAMPSHPRPSLVGREQLVQETCTAHHGQCYWNQRDHMPPRSEGQITNMFCCCKFLSHFLWVFHSWCTVWRDRIKSGICFKVTNAWSHRNWCLQP